MPMHHCLLMSDASFLLLAPVVLAEGTMVANNYVIALVDAKTKTLVQPVIGQDGKVACTVQYKVRTFGGTEGIEWQVLRSQGK